MFRKLLDRPSARVSIEIDGVAVTAEEGEPVAAVILRQSDPSTRQTPVSGERRAPYCMMGVCFDCLAEVDGIQSAQTCLIAVRDGMRVNRQMGKRKIGG